MARPNCLGLSALPLLPNGRGSRSRGLAVSVVRFPLAKALPCDQNSPAFIVDGQAAKGLGSAQAAACALADGDGEGSGSET